jgi:hypothetical protein
VKKMTQKEIEKLVLGIDANETEAWKVLQANWTGGVLVMPSEEVNRRTEYKAALKTVLTEAGVTPESISDEWLAGKVRRILK